MQLPLVPYYETCDEDGPCAPYFTGHITDADGRVMCITDSEERAIELVDCVDGLSANIDALRARLAEVEAQRDGLKDALEKIRGLYKGNPGGSVDWPEMGAIACEALAKLEEGK